MKKDEAIPVGSFKASRELLADLARVRSPFGRMDTRGEPNATQHYDWELVFYSGASQTGYDGALFSTEIDGQTHYFIYHQGTNNLRDLPDLVKIANLEMPSQFKEACRFTDQAMAYVQQNHPDQTPSVIQAGFSLGAILATLSCKENQPIIAYEPSGTEEILERQGRDSKAIGKHTLEVMSPHPDIVTTHGKHIGTILEVGEPYWETERPSIANFALLNAKAHRLDILAERIEDANNPLKQIPLEESTRPGNIFKAFDSYIDQYKGANPGLRVRLLEKVSETIINTGADTKIIHFFVSNAKRLLGVLTNGVFGREAVESAKSLGYDIPSASPTREEAIGETTTKTHTDEKPPTHFRDQVTQRRKSPSPERENPKR